jgi:hypothetical protein
MGLPPEWLDKFYDFTYYGTLGGFSALVGYLYSTVKQEHVKLVWMTGFVSVLVGWYLGMVVAGLLPADWDDKQRDSAVLLIGATGIKGFDLIVYDLTMGRIKKLFK